MRKQLVLLANATRAVWYHREEGMEGAGHRRRVRPWRRVVLSLLAGCVFQVGSG